MDSRVLTLSCPSARPHQEGAVVIGIVRESGPSPVVDILPAEVPVSLIIDLIPALIQPTEVLRFAAPCVERKCVHFEDDRCKLVERVVEVLPKSRAGLRKCAIRSTCRWWHQEGRAACERCPQIVTEPYVTTEVMRNVAQPPNSEAL
jgi:hypothetical protein